MTFRRKLSKEFKLAAVRQIAADERVPYLARVLEVSDLWLACGPNLAPPTRHVIKAGVVRAEAKVPKDNPRFVITNMKQSPQFLYEKVYCQSSEIESRNCTTYRSTAPVAAVSGPTSSGCC